MKSTFILGFVLAFAGVLSGAYFYPLAAPTRVNSITSVALNGGREETFVIRLPADRIASIGDGSSGWRGESFPAGLELPEAFRAKGLLVENYKLRNIEGDVIGLATRHWTFAPSGPEAVWAIVIPGRGTLVLAGPAELPLSVDAALGAQGYAPGESWEGKLSLDLVRNVDETRVVTGSEEFQNAQGTYRETWELTGMSANAEPRGTIEIRTQVKRLQ